MNCLHCKKEFEPRTHNQKYCCPSCCQKHWYQKKAEKRRTIRLEKKTCEFCGKKFTPKRSQSNQKFCCHSCCKQYWNQKTSSEIRQTIRAEEKTCEFCGKIFTVKHSHYQRFCSTKCQQDKYRGKQPPMIEPKETLNVIARIEGKTFEELKAGAADRMPISHAKKRNMV